MKRILSLITSLALVITLVPQSSVSAFDAVYAGADNGNDYAALVLQDLETGDVTEKTTAAKNTTLSDVTLYKNDGALYFGYSAPFDGISGEVARYATGGSYSVDYYDGDSWVDLISSTTANIANSTDGTFQLTWTRPSDWGKTKIRNYTDESGDPVLESSEYYFVRLNVTSSYTGSAIFSQIGIINYNLKLSIKDEFGESMDSHTGTATFASGADDTVYVTKDEGETTEYYGFYAPVGGSDYTYTYTVPGYVQATGTVELSHAQTSESVELEYTHKITATDASGNVLTISSATAGSSNTTCTINAKIAYCPVPLSEDGGTATISVTGYDSKSVSIPDRVTDSAAQQETTVVMGTTTTTTNPDLEVNDIYFSGNSLAANMGNGGNEDVASGTVIYVSVYVDGTRKINQTIDPSHFSAGESGVSTYLPSYFKLGEDYEIEVCLDSTNNVTDETSESNNCRTETLTYGSSTTSGEPNLTVDDLYFSGEKLYAEVSNDGDDDVDSGDSVTLAVYVDGDREYTSGYSYSYFEENESNTFSFENDNLWDEDEDYKIEVCVDYYDVVDESNENDSDNCRTETLTFNPSSEDGPDLDVTSIYISSDDEVKFKLTNKGDEDVDNGETVTIKVYVDDTVEVTTSEDQESNTTNFLDEGEEQTFNAGDILSDEGSTYEVKVCVDTGDDVDESNEDNNCMTVDEDSIGDESEEDNDACGTFLDVDGHWAEEYICDLFERDVVKGRTDYYFYPNDTVTRAEFLKMVLLSAEMDPYSVSSVQYTDVNSGDWFYSYVTYATAMGYVDGYSDGSFRPNDKINRAEALVILMRVADQNNYDFDANDIDYWDVETTDWYAYAVVIADQDGIVSGYSNGSFGPENNILRGESAKIIDLAYDEYFN